MAFMGAVTAVTPIPWTRWRLQGQAKRAVGRELLSAYRANVPQHVLADWVGKSPATVNALIRDAIRLEIIDRREGA
jgi:hypothetical protein